MIHISKFKLNKRVLNSELYRGLSSKKVETLAYDEAEKRAKAAKKTMIKEFNQSTITQELDAGAANTKNISRTLTGIPYGTASLFGFIGFDEGAKPAEIVREYLKDMGYVFKKGRFTRRATGGRYIFQVEVPVLSEIEPLTPMPWEGGRSWIRGIERGISGLSYFMTTKFKINSRSGQGIQITNKYFPGAVYKASKYFSAIANNFIQRLEGRQPKAIV